MPVATLEVPAYLSYDGDLSVAQYLMLTDCPRPSATRIELKTSHKPEQLAVTGQDTQLDFSLYRQMAQLLGTPLQESDPLPSAPPDCYLLTMYSALPIASTVRSIYKTLCLPKPAILPVCAAYSEERSENLKEHNIGFLNGKLSTVSHVCIIDQYVQYGHTVSDALDTCLTIEGPLVSIVRGRWYEDARRNCGDLTLPAMYTHVDTFTSVGEVIGKALLQKTHCATTPGTNLQ